MPPLPDRFATLSASKRLLMQRLLGRSQGIPPAPAGPVPLTREQERLWYLQGMLAGGGVLTIPMAFRIQGALRPDLLEQAVRALVERHDALRMVFSEVDGSPRQQPLEQPRYAWRQLDAAAAGPAETEAHVAQFLSAPFDLGRGPLLRVLLVRDPAQPPPVSPEAYAYGALDETTQPGPTLPRHRLYLAVHHLVADGWSLGVLREELGELYSAALEGRTPVLADTGSGFRDFAAWQRAQSPSNAAADEAWWRERLRGAPHASEVVPDFPRPALPSQLGFRAGYGVGAELTRKLREAARREGTTLASLVTAAWAEVLHRHAGEDELVLGTVDAGRRVAGVERMVGFFAHTLPLRCRRDPAARVDAAIAAAHAALREAREHAGVPFQRIVELAGVRRDPARPPLVQALLAFSEPGASPLRLCGAEVRPLGADTGGAAFDLTLQVEDHGDTLVTSLQLARDLYSPDSGSRLLLRLNSALLSFSADPAARVGDLPLAARAELPVPAQPPLAAESGADLVAAFERAAREHPQRIAVHSHAGELAYQALNQRANRIARRLRRLGAGPERRVGICLRRTPELLAAMLGVMKCGAAWVPLDPAHPPERVRAVLRAAGAIAVLGESACAAALAGVPELLRLELDRADLSHERDDDPGIALDPRSVAYVIATSGSTGTPKAVEIEHASAAALLEWIGSEIPPRARAAMLAGTAVTFDATLVETLGVLAWGGTVLLADGPFDPPPPGPAPRTTFMVPAVAAELLRQGRLPAGLEVLMVGGEALEPGLARALQAQGGVGRLLNVYGPTEDTTFSTWSRLEPGVERVDIGRAVPHGRAYVLDRALRPLPPGMPGEIWLAGAGVARGYAGRPALTADSFRPDPWGPPGARMYRSRDLGRWRSCGALEYLGRRDTQLKVHGVRVEAGEVEAALAGHPAVAAAAAGLRLIGGTRRELVAWLVASPDQPRPTPAELRAHLGRSLPRALHPAAFVWLQALPRTDSGKLDRRALPDPLPGAAPARAAPRSPTEARLAPLWAQVLELDRVGIHDDFFDLGGQSILAARLAARVRAELGRELPLAQLLEAPTVARMAALLDGDGARVPPPLVPLRTGGEGATLYLAPPGGGHVVCYHALAALLGEHRVYGLQARGIDDGEPPLASVEALAAWFVDALRARDPEGPYHLGGWSFGGVVAWEMARQLEAAGAEVGVLALLDSAEPTPRERTGDALSHARVLQRIVADLVGWGAASQLRVERLAPLSPREQALEAVRTLGLPQLLPASRVEEMLALTRVRRANLESLVSYRPAPYPGPLTYFRTSAADRARPLDDSPGFWSALAGGGVEVVTVGGSHGTLLQHPFVGEVAAGLSRALEGCLAARK